MFDFIAELPGMLVQALSSKIVMQKMAKVCGAKTKTTPACSFIPKVVKRKIDLLGLPHSPSDFSHKDILEVTEEPNVRAFHDNNVSQKMSTVQSTSPVLHIGQRQSTCIPQMYSPQQSSNRQQGSTPTSCSSPQQQHDTPLQQSTPQSQSTSQ